MHYYTTRGYKRAPRTTIELVYSYTVGDRRYEATERINNDLTRELGRIGMAIDVIVMPDNPTKPYISAMYGVPDNLPASPIVRERMKIKQQVGTSRKTRISPKKYTFSQDTLLRNDGKIRGAVFVLAFTWMGAITFAFMKIYFGLVVSVLLTLYCIYWYRQRTTELEHAFQHGTVTTAKIHAIHYFGTTPEVVFRYTYAHRTYEASMPLPYRWVRQYARINAQIDVIVEAHTPKRPYVATMYGELQNERE